MSTMEGAVTLINHLIRTCVEGGRGFEAAADVVSDPRIKTELANYSLQRQQFASELQTRLPQFGVEGQEGAYAPIEFPVSFAMNGGSNSRRESHNILAACKQAEDAAVDAYRSALGAELPDEYAMLIEAQYEAIQDSHDRIKVLSHATANHWTQ